MHQQSDMQEWYADTVYEFLFVTSLMVCDLHTPATTNPYVSCQQHVRQVVSCILLSGHLGAVAHEQAQVAVKHHTCIAVDASRAQRRALTAHTMGPGGRQPSHDLPKAL